MRLFLLALSALLALYWGFFAYDGQMATNVVGYLGYWTSFACFALLVFSLGKLAWSAWSTQTARLETYSELKKSRFRLLAAVAAVLSLGSVMLASQPKNFKIVMDEPVLVSTSLGMHMDRETYGAAYNYEVNGVSTRLGKYVDKRPLFYPFLVSQLHDWTGYRVNQGIWLNCGLLIVLLGLIYALGARLCPPFGGYIGLAMAAGVPLISVNATSSGFDILNLVLILAWSCFLARYLAKRDGGEQDVFVLFAIALANTRYESVLFVFPTGLAILYVWWSRKRPIITPITLFAPLLMVCYPLQRKIMNRYGDFWQLPEHLSSPFSFGFIAENLRHAADFFLSVGDIQPNSLLLSVASLLSGFILIYGILRKGLNLNWPRHWCLSFAAAAVIVVVNFLLLMCYHWGQLDDGAATRLALPIILFQIFFVLLVIRSVHAGIRVQLFVCAASLGFFLLVVRPACARTDFLKYAIRNGQVAYSLTLAERLGPNALLISDRSPAPSLTRISSIDVSRALYRLPELELHQRLRTFEDIYVLYLIPTKLATDEIFQIEQMRKVKTKLEEAFGMVTVQLEKINDAAYLRLAKVTEIHLPASKKLDFDMSGMSISYTGKIDFLDASLPEAFVRSLP